MTTLASFFPQNRKERYEFLSSALSGLVYPHLLGGPLTTSLGWLAGRTVEVLAKEHVPAPSEEQKTLYKNVSIIANFSTRILAGLAISMLLGAPLSLTGAVGFAAFSFGVELVQRHLVPALDTALEKLFTYYFPPTTV